MAKERAKKKTKQKTKKTIEIMHNSFWLSFNQDSSTCVYNPYMTYQGNQKSSYVIMLRRKISKVEDSLI